MDYTKIRAPFISGEATKNKANWFRQKFWDNSIPVDIEHIVEIKMKMDIIPVSELKRDCDADALIASDWKSVYVDKNGYLDERYQNRLRFSLAHEIGHFVLHKNLYNSFKIDTPENFYRLIDKIPSQQYGYLEMQSNYFANFLLVPRDRLAVEKEKALSNLKKTGDINRDNINEKLLFSYLAGPISKIFGVSSQVIEIALGE